MFNLISTGLFYFYTFFLLSLIFLIPGGFLKFFLRPCWYASEKKMALLLPSSFFRLMVVFLKFLLRLVDVQVKKKNGSVTDKQVWTARLPLLAPPLVLYLSLYGQLSRTIPPHICDTCTEFWRPVCGQTFASAHLVGAVTPRLVFG